MGRPFSTAARGGHAGRTATMTTSLRGFQFAAPGDVVEEEVQWQAASQSGPLHHPALRRFPPSFSGFACLPARRDLVSPPAAGTPAARASNGTRADRRA